MPLEVIIKTFYLALQRDATKHLYYFIMGMLLEAINTRTDKVLRTL
jgi:hypothetical protein